MDPRRERREIRRHLAGFEWYQRVLGMEGPFVEVSCVVHQFVAERVVGHLPSSILRESSSPL